MREEWKEYYLFLELVRESGAINMFGARPYLEETFDLDRKTASEVLSNWMTNYKEIKAKYFA